MNPTQLTSNVDVIFHRCYRILGDRDLAWDALQEVMTKYLEVLAQREIQHPIRYLYRMSTNVCIDMIRRHALILPLDMDTGNALGTTKYTQVESQMIIENLCEQFGEDALTLLVYRYVEHMTYQEIGEICGKSDRGIKKKLDRIEQKIRHYLSR